MRQPIATKLAELRKQIERIEATPRKAFTKAQRYAVHEAQEGRCAACETTLTGRWDIDHAITIWDGGAHDPSNWIGLCIDCHKRKSAQDAANRAHTKRLIKREELGQASSRLQTRPFPKDRRRKMDGTVQRVSGSMMAGAGSCATKGGA